MTNAETMPTPSKAKPVATWVLQIVLAAAFLAAATAKLAGVPMLVQEFQQIGLGQAFRYVTAAVEIVGAIALLTPGFAVAGAALLGVTMCFATLAHLFRLHTNPAPAIVLIVLCAIVIWLRRDQVAALRSRFT